MSATAQELFDAGDLTGAIEAMNAEVRAHPADLNARGFLAELLCFAGNLDRADVMMEAVSRQDSDNSIGVALFRQQLRAALARQQTFTEGRAPEMLDQPTEHMRLSLQALASLRAGDTREAADLCAQAEAIRPPISGTHDDTPFDDMRDVDDITAGILEVLTSTGKYYWVPMEAVREIEFRPVEKTRDLLWRRAHVVVTNGPEGEVYIPAIYPWAADPSDQQALLGRSTDWLGGEDATSPVRGIGQRMYLVGNAGVPILDMGAFIFAGAA